MSELDSLIQNVIDHPLDDQCRLVLADYLEEQGDTRAQLIRLQLELAELPEYSARYATLRKKERTLYREHGAFGKAPPNAKVVSYHGGFISGIKMTIPRFRAQQNFVFTEAQITELWLTGSFARLPQLSELETLRNVKKLTLQVPRAPKDKLLPFLLSPYLTELRTLTIGSSEARPDDYLSEYVAKTHSTKLEDLRVAHFPTSITKLASGQRIQCFKSVVLQARRRYRDEEVTTLVTAPMFRELEYLTAWGLNENHLQQLATAPWAATLRRLRLVRCNCRYYDLRFPNLREAYFTVIQRTPDLMRDVINSFDELEVLDLSSCFLNDDDAALLAASPLLEKLRRLDLSYNGISLVGAQALGRSPFRKRGLKMNLVSPSLFYTEDRRKLKKEFGATFGTF